MKADLWFCFVNFRGRIFFKSILCEISFSDIQVQLTKSPKEHLKNIQRFDLRSNVKNEPLELERQ